MRTKVRTKVTFINNGRQVNLVIKCTESELSDYRERIISERELVYDNLSDGQRRKIEKFYGKMNAYYSQIEIL